MTNKYRQIRKPDVTVTSYGDYYVDFIEKGGRVGSMPRSLFEQLYQEIYTPQPPYSANDKDD